MGWYSAALFWNCLQLIDAYADDVLENDSVSVLSAAAQRRVANARRTPGDGTARHAPARGGLAACLRRYSTRRQRGARGLGRDATLARYSAADADATPCLRASRPFSVRNA